MEQYLQIIQTKDGSDSLLRTDLGETYHSRHGAANESEHVFIESGLKHLTAGTKRINLLEVGFGTGLNALLTLLAIEQIQGSVYYVGLEPYPVPQEIAMKLSYKHKDARIEKMHRANCDEDIEITPAFVLHKSTQKVLDYASEKKFDLIYYDAFGPATQPEMWTEEVFAHLFQLLSPGGVLTTYCAKGEVRRTMQRVGLQTERLPGPPGKREMLRATKPQS